MTITEQILLGLWKMAWAWIPLMGAMIIAGIYEHKKGIKL